jgi:hypothetical protein
MDSEYASTSTETASDSSSNVTLDDISSIASEVVGTGCRFLGVVIELGNNMTSLSEANLWQEGAATPLQFLLDQLDLSEKNIDWRCIAGSYALYCFETDVLCRPCHWNQETSTYSMYAHTRNFFGVPSTLFSSACGVGVSGLDFTLMKVQWEGN